MGTEKDNEMTMLPRRPRLSFYHPNGKGTGCALRFALYPAHDNEDGYIMMELANQLTVGDRRGPNPVYAKFDWENKILVKLVFDDLSRMLQVFRGECESLEEGRGLYHRTAKFSTRISLRHMLEPIQGYSLEVYRNATGSDDENHAHFILSSNEALGLVCSIESSLGVLCFGVPHPFEGTKASVPVRKQEKGDAAAA